MVSGAKPVWATELGYSNALAAPAGQQPVSEYAGAVYLLREFLGNYQAGIARTYAYELIDDAADPTDANIQDHYGLLRADYTPKPAFTALENLLALVGDQPPGPLAGLAVSPTQGPGDLHQLVLQQSPGSYVVVLWRLASVWNVTARTAIDVGATPVTLNVPAAVTAGRADPLSGQQLTPLPLDHGQLHTTIAADPIIIHITTASQPGTPTTGTSSSQGSQGSASSQRPAATGPATGGGAGTSRHRRSGRTCRAVQRRAPTTHRATRSLAHWLTAQLKRHGCADRHSTAQVSLYVTAGASADRARSDRARSGRARSGRARFGRARSGRGLSHRRAPIARRRVTSRSVRAIASWIVARSRAQARHDRTLIIGLS